MNQPSTSSKAINHRTTRRFLAASVFALLLAFVAIPASGATQQEFKSGQDAFRAGEFATAASHFERALKQGHDQGPAAYNLGVAHYRAKNYDAAENAFLIASRSTKFAATSYYNLGLVERRRGNATDARIWFAQAETHRTATSKLRRLARKAMAKLPQEHATVRWSLQPRETKISDLIRMSFHTGYGTDSNVYQSPSASYVDLADPNSATIDPVVVSGTYIPVTAATDIGWKTYHDGYFKLHYDFAGKFYTDQELSNANEMEHRFYIGGVIDKDTPRGGWYWSGRFVVERYEQDAFDRDNGNDQVAGNEDVTDRLKYTKAGPRIFYERELGQFAIGFKASGYIRNYDETLDFLDLTHEQYSAGVHFSYQPWQRTLIRLSASGSLREYINRVAKDTTGTRIVGNDTLQYEYLNAGLTLRQQLTSSLAVTVYYRYTERTDTFLAYEDYSRHTGRLAVRFKQRRLTARLAYAYRTYDFPNAFAFDNPAADLRTLETSYISLEAGYQFTDKLGVHLTLDKDVVESNDTRSEFDRNLASLSLTLRL